MTCLAQRVRFLRNLTRTGNAALAVLFLVSSTASPSRSSVAGAQTTIQSIAAERNREGRENYGLTPFFLQDPADGLCLGPHGIFTACTEATLWAYASVPAPPSSAAGTAEGHGLVRLLHPDPRQSCLLRPRPRNILGTVLAWCRRLFGGGGGDGGMVRVGRCRDAKQRGRWILLGPNEKGYFKLSNFQKKYQKKTRQCLTRYKGSRRPSSPPVRNSATMQPCRAPPSSASSSGYVQLNIVETAIHDAGFYLVTADGTCFDGAAFRKCESRDGLLWGVGIEFLAGRGSRDAAALTRVLYKFFRTGECLVAVPGRRNAVKMGSCKSRHARSWGLSEDGRLSRDNGRTCVVRLVNNLAGTRPCREAYEHLSVHIPQEAENARAKRTGQSGGGKKVPGGRQ